MLFASDPGVGLPLVTSTVGINGCTAVVDWQLSNVLGTSVCDGEFLLVGSDESTTMVAHTKRKILSAHCSS
jgi:hypothetical protein